MYPVGYTTACSSTISSLPQPSLSAASRGRTSKLILPATMGESSNPSIQVAIIGAGYAGLCASRHFSADSRYTVTVFEQADHVGGPVWNYPAGCEDHRDVDGTSRFYTRAYRSLRTLAPVDLMALEDYPFPKLPSSSFCSTVPVQEYLDGYKRHFHLDSLIKFRHCVRSIAPCLNEPVPDRGSRWTVTVENLENSAIFSAIYDVVLICVGRNNTPHLPNLPMVNNFSGPITHTSQYRTPDGYTGQTVLLVGAGNSGRDVAIELASVAKKVIFCHGRPDPLLCNKFPNVTETVMVSGSTVDSVILQDGTSEKCDSIILATGYAFDFPFLHESCRVKAGRGRVTPLYQHLIHCEFPSMAFPHLIGLCPITPVIDYQMKYCKAVMDGKVKLPTTEDMLAWVEADFQERLTRKPPLATTELGHGLGFDVWLYIEELIRQADLPAYEPVLKKMFEFAVGWDVPEHRFQYRTYRLDKIDSENYLVETNASGDKCPNSSNAA